jgi:hypothetical protein
MSNHDDSSQEVSKEEVIIRSMKLVLTNVVKETATAPGLKHPLSEGTIGDIRDLLVLITEREKQLREARGAAWEQRPRFTDEPGPEDQEGGVVVPISSIGRPRKDG